MGSQYQYHNTKFGARSWGFLLVVFLLISLAICTPILFYLPGTLTKPEDKDLYSKICIPLIAACATFCITLSTRITVSSERIRKLSEMFGKQIEQNDKQPNDPQTLLRCSTIIRQIALLQDKYLISRVSFSSKVFGILAFISMVFFAYTDNLLAAKACLYAGLSMLLTGFIISVYDVSSGHLSLRRELEYIDFEYGALLSRTFHSHDDRRLWLDSRFNERIEIFRRLLDQKKEIDGTSLSDNSQNGYLQKEDVKPIEVHRPA